MKNKFNSKSTIEVIHVITSLNTGGAEKMLIRLATHENSNNKYKHSIISLSKLRNDQKHLQSSNLKNL